MYFFLAPVLKCKRRATDFKIFFDLYAGYTYQQIIENM